jgi:hypothetical protein
MQIIEPRFGGNVFPALDPLLDGIPRDLLEIDPREMPALTSG